MGEKQTLSEVIKKKSDAIMEGVAYWASFYRKNPQRFVKEFLNINLKLFQKILIYMMMISTNFMYIASRGSGKTWLTALYCVVRCILYPGTKICVASGVKSQALEVITKIETDFLKNYSWGSSNLANEIEYISTSMNNARVDFFNGSWITIVTANDNSRHNRATTIVVDEFRLVPLNVINTVLRKFLTTSRMPGYLNNPKYAHLQERNTEMYMSSAWYQSHWSFEKAKSYFANMLDDKRKYFCVSLPYQLAIKEGLLSREQVEDEMSEADFDEISWSMEMEALFYGDSDEAFYRYEDLSKCRKLKESLLPLEFYDKKGMKVPELHPNERRILSVDVALMASKKHANDAAAIDINIALPNNNSYSSNFVYKESFEGLTTDDLGITIMRYFYKYKCTDLVLDCQGNGLGVYDYIIKSQFDPVTGEVYGALTACNNPEMASRCKDKNAKKCIWCIKATADFNSNAATLLRAGIKNGNVKFLINEFDASDVVSKVTGYKKMSINEQAKLLMPYTQTSLTVNEMINLEHEIVNNKVKLKEKSGMRKDRFSSVEYNYYVTQIISNTKQKRYENKDVKKLLLSFRAPKYN